MSVLLVVTAAAAWGCGDDGSETDAPGGGGSSSDSGGSPTDDGPSGGAGLGDGGQGGQGGGMVGVGGLPGFLGDSFGCLHPYGTLCYQHSGPDNIMSQEVQQCSNLEMSVEDACPTDELAATCTEQNEYHVIVTHYYESYENLEDAELECVEYGGTWDGSP